MCLPDSDENKHYQLWNCKEKVKISKRKLEAKQNRDQSMRNRSDRSKRRIE